MHVCIEQKCRFSERSTVCTLYNIVDDLLMVVFSFGLFGERKSLDMEKSDTVAVAANGCMQIVRKIKWNEMRLGI